MMLNFTGPELEALSGAVLAGLLSLEQDAKTHAPDSHTAALDADYDALRAVAPRIVQAARLERSLDARQSYYGPVLERWQRAGFTDEQLSYCAAAVDVEPPAPVR